MKSHKCLCSTRNNLCMTFSCIYFPRFSAWFVPVLCVYSSGDMSVYVRFSHAWNAQGVCLHTPEICLHVDHWHIKAGWGGFCSHWASANTRQSRRMRFECAPALQTKRGISSLLQLSAKNTSSSVLLSPAHLRYLNLDLVSGFMWIRNETLTLGLLL